MAAAFLVHRQQKDSSGASGCANLISHVSVAESKTATCCQPGWKSHPTMIMKASP